jgi:hypothetical protein
MFRVDWLQVAVNELAKIWMRADSTERRVITQASNIIDEKLRTDPFGSSESREREDRVLFEPPLGILFRVDLSKRNISVGHVWYYARRGR